MGSGVLVTGADGTLGRLVARDLRRRGLTVTGLGRRRQPVGWRGDWIRGDMLDPAVLAQCSADSIAHCATDPSSPKRDLGMVRALIDFAKARDIHIVHLGIAGIDRAVSSPYYAAKLEGERQLRASGVSHALVRSTQFHPFVLSVLRQLEKPPVMLCPALSFQPVDPARVAELVGRCAEQRAEVEALVNGPERLTVRELVHEWLRHRHVRRLQLPMPSIGPLAPMASIQAVEGISGGRRWAQWLEDCDGDRG